MFLTLMLLNSFSNKSFAFFVSRPTVKKRPGIFFICAWTKNDDKSPSLTFFLFFALQKYERFPTADGMRSTNSYSEFFLIAFSSSTTILLSLKYFCSFSEKSRSISFISIFASTGSVSSTSFSSVLFWLNFSFSKRASSL